MGVSSVSSDVTDGGADGRGAIENDCGIDAKRNGCLNRRKLLAYPVHRLNDVGAGLAKDDESNRALPVQIAGCTDVLDRIHNPGDVGQADRRAVAITDDERLIVFRARDLVVGKNVCGHHAIGDLALGQIGVLQAQYRLQIRNGKPVAANCVRIGVHTHRRQRAASDSDLPHTLYLRQLLLYDGGTFVLKVYRGRILSDVRQRIMIGESAGLTLR